MCNNESIFNSSYIDALKAENTNKESVEVVSDTGNAETKKKSELERTVLVLRRIVEKLQAENKRLLNGKRPFSDRVVSIKIILITAHVLLVFRLSICQYLQLKNTNIYENL